MKELQNILHLFSNRNNDELFAVDPFAQFEGSSYFRPRTHMIVRRDWEAEKGKGLEIHTKNTLLEIIDGFLKRR